MDDIMKIFMKDSKESLLSNLPHAKVDWSHNFLKGNLLSPKTMQQLLLVWSLPALQQLPGSL